MGWRWPWSRRSDEPEHAPSTADPVRAPAAPAPSPMGWAFLPPLQRTLAEPITPITRPSVFPTELPAWRSPMFTGDLTHAVVDSAPAGVVDGDGGGVGTPSATAAPVEMTLLPPPRPAAVQRSTGQRSVAAPSAAPSTAPPAAPPSAPTLGESAPVVDPAPVDLEPPAPSLTTAPAVGMPLVHREVVPEPAPVQRAPAVETAAVEAAPTESPGPPTEDARPASEPPAASEPETDRPTGATLPPIVSTQLGGVGRPSTVQRSVDTSLAPGSPASLAPHTGETRARLGLGPPLAAVPESAVAEPSPDAPSPVAAPAATSDSPPGLPLATPPSDEASPADEPPGVDGFTEVPIQRSVAAPRSAPAVPSVPAVRPVAPEAPGSPVIADLPLAPSVGDATEPPVGPTAAVEAEPEASVEAAEPVAEVADAPLLGRRTSVQRSTVEESAPPFLADDRPSEPEGPPPATGPVVSAEPPPASVPSAPLPLSAGPPTSIQRSSVLPGPGTPRPSLVVRPASPIPVQRSAERVVRVQRVPADEPLNPAPQPPPPAGGPVVSRFPSFDRPSLDALGGLASGAAERLADRAPQLPADLGRPASQAAQTLAALAPQAPADAGALAAQATEQLAGLAPQVPAALAGLAPDVPQALAGAVPTTPAALAGLAPQVPADLGGLASQVPGGLAGLAPGGLAGPAPAVPQLPLAAPQLPGMPALPGAPAATGAAAAPASEAAAAPDAAPPAAAPAGSSPPASAPAAAAAAAGAGGAAGAAGGAQPGDVEAMAQKVFPSVLRRIKAELLIDRERRGSRTDAW